MVNDEGEDLIEISKDATGAFSFDVDPENLDEIAEKMGITEEAVIACFEALSMWGDIDFYDLTEVSEVIDEIGLSAETAAGKAINVDRLTEQLMTLGTTAAAIQSVTNNENTDNSMGEIRIENHFEVKNADEKSARELAEYYSDCTIDKLMTAAKRKGMKNSIGSHMLR